MNTQNIKYRGIIQLSVGEFWDIYFREMPKSLDKKGFIGRAYLEKFKRSSNGYEGLINISFYKQKPGEIGKELLPSTEEKLPFKFSQEGLRSYNYGKDKRFSFLELRQRILNLISTFDPKDRWAVQEAKQNALKQILSLHCQIVGEKPEELWPQMKACDNIPSISEIIKELEKMLPSQNDLKSFQQTGDMKMSRQVEAATLHELFQGLVQEKDIPSLISIEERIMALKIGTWPLLLGKNFEPEEYGWLLKHQGLGSTVESTINRVFDQREIVSNDYTKPHPALDALIKDREKWFQFLSENIHWDIRLQAARRSNSKEALCALQGDEIPSVASTAQQRLSELGLNCFP